MPTIGTRDDWRTARLALLEREKDLTKRSDELAQARRDLPWVQVEANYTFDTPNGPQDPARPLRRPLPTARLPLHVRPGLGRRLP